MWSQIPVQNKMSQQQSNKQQEQHDTGAGRHNVSWIWFLNKQETIVPWPNNFTTCLHIGKVY